MRIPKALVACIILLAVAVWDLKPRMAEYADMRNELARLKKLYARELLFQSKHAEIEKELEAALQVDSENQKKLYPGNMPPQTALNQLQELLKRTVQSSGLEIVNFKWGDPYKKEKSNFFVLPISLMAQGDPPQIEDFFDRVLSLEKTLNFPIVNIVKGNKDQLILEATVTGYQLPPELK